MADFDELKLQVTLVDNATPQLTSIKREIEGLGGNNLQSFKRQTADADDQLKKLMDTVIKGPEAWLKYAAGLAGAGIAANALVGGVTNLIGKLTELGSEMNSLGARARSAAMDPADLREISEAVERATGAPTAETEGRIERFRQKLGALKGEMISTMMKVPDLGNAGVQIMAKLSDDLDKTKVPHEQINLVRKALDEAYDEILRSTGDANKAQNVRRQLEEATDLGGVLSRKIKDPFQAASDERKKIMAMEQAAGAQILTTQVTIMQNWTRIKDLMLIDFKDSALAKGMSWLADKLDQMSKEAEARRAAERDDKDKPKPEKGASDFLFGGRGPGQFLPWNMIDPQSNAPMPPPAAGTGTRRTGRYPGAGAGGGLSGGAQQLMDTGQGGQRSDSGLPDIGGIRVNQANWDKMINDPKLIAMGRAKMQYADREGNLSSTPPQQVQQTKVVQEQNNETNKLIDTMKRTNAILSGPTNKFKLMSTGFGGGAGTGGYGGYGTGTGTGPSTTSTTDGSNPNNTNPNTSPTTANPPPGANPPPKLPTPLNAPTIPGAGPANIPGLPGTPSGPAARPFATPQLTTFAGAAGIPGQPGTQSGAAPGRPPPGNVDAAGVQGMPGSPSGPAAPRGTAAPPAAPGAEPTAGNISIPRQGGGGPQFSAQVNQAIEAAAASSGLSKPMLQSIAQIESSGSPQAVTGSYKGLFQLSEKEFKELGGKGSVFDPAENARIAAAKIKREGDQLSKKLGRPATEADLYLAHQQGVGGAYEHLTHPDRPAWQAMHATAEGQQKGEAWAKKAIWGNIPQAQRAQFGSVENVTSGQFTTLWQDRYARGLGYKNWAEAQAAGQKQPGAAPVRTASTTQQAAPGAAPAPPQAVTGQTGGGTAIAGSVDDAMKLYGLDEDKDRVRLKAYMHTSASLSGEENAWCARFINQVIENAGGTGTKSLAARSFLKWGQTVPGSEKVLKGDVFVFPRGRDPSKGHVSIATGESRVNPKTGQTEYQQLEGNINDKVTTERWRTREQAIGVRRDPRLQQPGNLPPQPANLPPAAQPPAAGPVAQPPVPPPPPAPRDMPPAPEIPAILRGGRPPREPEPPAAEEDDTGGFAAGKNLGAAREHLPGSFAAGKPGSSTFDRSRLTFTDQMQDVEPDRRALDRGLAARQWGARRQQIAARANIDVSVSTKGQQSINQAGPFKRIPMTRHTQMRKAEEGPKSAPPMQGGGNDHDAELDS